MFKVSFSRNHLKYPGASLIALAALTLVLAGEPSLPARGGFSAPQAQTQAVKVTTRRDGNKTHFYVDNQEYCEVTMTFDMGLKNLEGNKPFPYTATFPPRQITEAFELTPSGTNAEWEYSYTNYYKLGSMEATHEDSYLYQLPYAPGRSFRVTQSANGSFSHKGSNRYAIDWNLPEGTRVYAARGGMVVKVKQDSDKGGSNMKYDSYNNYVLVRHDDGTLGHYCHLKKNGVQVKPGQRIRAGEWIAVSGNTGFSSGPHLHFCVFKTRNGKERESIPIRFNAEEGSGLTLATGRKYKALTPSGLATDSMTAATVPEPSQGARGSALR